MKQILCIAVLLLGFSTVLARVSPTLKTSLSHGGVLVGKHMTSLSGKNIRAYLGVPYAQPPIGENRFKAALPFGSWEGERLAITDGNSCIQISPFVLTEQEPTGSEDCLYLNVYVPGSPKTNGSLPVMFWLHGGAFIYGDGSSTLYPPDYLLERDVILVTVNYRLGPMGFLSTETTDVPGNFGLKDQVLALKWVQENIAAFGGDPNSVSLVGWSSGAASAVFQTMSPTSKGLFHKIILESGSYKNVWAGPFPKGAAANKTIVLANFLNCETSPLNWTSIVECLRSKSATELTSATLKFREWDVYPIASFLPVIEPPHEGAFLTTEPTSTPESFAIPMLTGFNKDEGLFATLRLVQTADMQQAINGNLSQRLPIMLLYQYQPEELQKNITKSILDYYVKGGANFTLENFQNLTDLISDAWMIAPFSEYMQERLSNNSAAPTYAYTLSNKGYVSYTDFAGGEKFYGSSHGDELLSLFPQADILQPSLEPEARDRKLIENMVELWTNFVTTGNPTPQGSELPTWIPANVFPPRLMHIGSIESEGILLQMTTEFPVDRMEFWEKLKPFKWT